MSTPLERELIHARDGGLCGFCGQPVDLQDAELDHYPIGRAVGGESVQKNVRIAHASCNRKAGWQMRKAVGGPRSTPAAVDTWLLQVPAELGKEVRELAEREHRSLTAQVQVLLVRALATEKEVAA